MKKLLAVQVLYPLAMFFTKTSFFLLILRIFGPNSKARILVYFGASMCTAFYIIAFVLYMFFCAPRPEDMGMLHPTCATQGNAFNIGFAGFNVASDLYILEIPLPVIWSLNMTTSRKIGICAIILLGLL
jgi:hypothetical protein